MTLRQLVARNLRAARLARKLPQKSIADRANVTVSYVSMLERGLRSPPLATLEAVASALRVPVGDLLSDGRAPTTAARPRFR